MVVEQPSRAVQRAAERKAQRPPRVRKKRNVPDTHAAALGDQIEDPETYGVRTVPRGFYKRRRQARAEGRDSDPDSDAEEAAEAAADAQQSLPGALTETLLREARAQQQEVEEEEAAARGVLGPSSTAGGPSSSHRRQTRGGADGFPATHTAVVDSDEDDSEDEMGYGGYGGGPGGAAGADWDAEVEEEVSLEDEAALRAFMAPGAENYKQRTLADIIIEKLKQQEVGESGDGGKGALPPPPSSHSALPPIPGGLDAKVTAVYRQLGQLLQRYKAGRVPRALKVVPSLSNWEEVLFLTEPESWSPHATYQATRIFVSNLNSKMAQRFTNLVLLPAVRADIRENKRLHFALFQALRKATYKPGAFYKGFLLPLCSSGSCTLREAVIVSSVLRRTTIPVVHSAAALLRLADMDYGGVNSFFIRVLLDKRYALPYRVVDALVDHFLSFKQEQRQLPVVWHQSLLVFVQRYKNEIRGEDKAALRQLLRVQHHYQVSPEVYRELDAGRDRGQKPGAGAGAEVQSRVGTHVTEDPRDMAPVMMMEDEQY